MSKKEQFQGRSEDGRIWHIEVETPFQNGHEGRRTVRTFIDGVPVTLDRRDKGEYWCDAFDELYGNDGFLILCDDPAAP